jgi:uncharacterized protein
MKFINREKETKFLKEHFESEPNSLLFIYGPKSSGKSSLLNKVAENMDPEKYAVTYLSLRSVLIYNFKTFLDVFFPKSFRGKTQDILKGLTLNFGFFSVKTEEENFLRENPFGMMTNKLISANKRGIKPVIIIDEIQLLKNIGLNGERYLIDELFNLFIEITKTKHVSHVVLATSDSYFIEEIYNSAKLSKTSEFLLLDHLDKKDVATWLQEENFKNEEIKTVWSYIGGSPWEIEQIIKKKNQGERVVDIVNGFINEQFFKISDYIYVFEAKKRKVFDKVIKEIITHGYCLKQSIYESQILMSLLKEMIEHDLWFYKANEGKIMANSKSIYWAFKELIKGIKKL